MTHKLIDLIIEIRSNNNLAIIIINKDKTIYNKKLEQKK